MIVKAADFLSITSKKESDVTLRKLKERIEELEKAKTETKSEFGAEKTKFEERLYYLEAEKNSSIRNEKLIEERMKFQNVEKEKSDKIFFDKWAAKVGEKD